MSSEQRTVAIIGGGPAGLRAAEVAAKAGAAVTLYDAKASVGRKFLVAGKSGLNLTNVAEFESFVAQYSGPHFPVELWRGYLAKFDNHAIGDWAASLGVSTFSSTSGKVFPEGKKAAPLLRRWVLRLRGLGVVFKMNHRWVGLRKGEGIELDFETGESRISGRFDSVVLACGGASWPKTGSDGKWVERLEALGVLVEPLQSANCGWECDWTDETRALVEGKPLHNLEVRAGNHTEAGELMPTRYGFEGAPIYALGRTLREMTSPWIEIDFKPTFTIEHMVHKMESARRDFFKEARLRWKLTPAACAIIEQYYGVFDAAEPLAKVVKSCRIPLTQARSISEVISTAGGVSWNALDASLMLKEIPGVYCAGEMIDWEAPTGGYLIQGCFSSGSIAGAAAAGME